jgi:hypothetical protein
MADSNGIGGVDVGGTNVGVGDDVKLLADWRIVSHMTGKLAISGGMISETL